VANRVLASSAPRRWPFDAEAIKARATRATGLNDFGVDVPLDEPLTALCADLSAGPPMHPDVPRDRSVPQAVRATWGTPRSPRRGQVADAARRA
jgi:hypothetical protein